MQLNQDIYLESASLFQQIFVFYFPNSPESVEVAAPFEVGGLTFRRVESGASADAFRDGRIPAIFMDEAYDDAIARRGQYDLILWLNAADEPAPGRMPEHDLDFNDIAQLASLSAVAPRPGLSQCLDWWDEWAMPENIRRHVTEVAGAAYKLAIWMRQAGVDVDPILTHRAGLVHDLDKIETLHQAGRHGHVSADFLQEEGYPELADIVRNHLLGIFLSRDMAVLSWETKLVNFCDKLVEGDRIVSITERFTALKQRYPRSQGLIDSAEPYLWQLNEEICTILSLDGHDELVARLND